MGRTFRDLFLALLNATLILVALCLFLAWQVFAAARQTTQNLEETAAQIRPVADQIGGLRQDVTALRADIDQLRAGSTASERASLTAKITALDRRMEKINQEVSALRALPEELVKEGVFIGVDRLMDRAAGLRGCTPTDDPLG